VKILVTAIGGARIGNREFLKQAQLAPFTEKEEWQQN
jgi:hypothetical protein